MNERINELTAVISATEPDTGFSDALYLVHQHLQGDDEALNKIRTVLGQQRSLVEAYRGAVMFTARRRGYSGGVFGEAASYLADHEFADMRAALAAQLNEVRA